MTVAKPLQFEPAQSNTAQTGTTTNRSIKRQGKSYDNSSCKQQLRRDDDRNAQPGISLEGA